MHNNKKAGKIFFIEIEYSMSAVRSLDEVGTKDGEEWRGNIAARSIEKEPQLSFRIAMSVASGRIRNPYYEV